MNFTRCLVMLAAVAVLVIARRTEAAPPSKEAAKAQAELVVKAQAAFKEKRWDDVIALMVEAMGHGPNPTIVYNIARANEEKGDATAAIRFFEQYAAMKGVKPAEAAEARGRVAALRAKATQAGQIVLRDLPPQAVVKVGGAVASPDGRGTLRVGPGNHLVTVTAPGREPWESKVTVTPGGTIELTVGSRELPAKIKVTCSVAGAKVSIDGHLGGSANQTLVLTAGRHEVSVSAPGHKTLVRTVSVAAGADLTLPADLEPIAVAVIPTKRTDPTIVTSSEPESRGMSAFTKAGIGTLISGLVVVGVGGAFTGLAAKERSAVEDAAVDGKIDPSRMTMVEASEREAKANNFSDVAIVGYALGGALVVTSIILFSLPNPTAVSATVEPIPGGALLTASGRF